MESSLVKKRPLPITSCIQKTGRLYGEEQRPYPTLGLFCLTNRCVHFSFFREVNIRCFMLLFNRAICIDNSSRSKAIRALLFIITAFHRELFLCLIFCSILSTIYKSSSVVCSTILSYVYILVLLPINECLASIRVLALVGVYAVHCLTDEMLHVNGFRMCSSLSVVYRR